MVLHVLFDLAEVHHLHEPPRALVPTGQLRFGEGRSARVVFDIDQVDAGAGGEADEGLCDVQMAIDCGPMEGRRSGVIPMGDEVRGDEGEEIGEDVYATCWHQCSASERGGVLTGVAVSGGHVEDGVAVVVGGGVEGVWGEGGDEVLDVGEVSEAAAEEDVLLVLCCRRGRHDARSVISHPHHHRVCSILLPCALLLLLPCYIITMCCSPLPNLWRTYLPPSTSSGPSWPPWCVPFLCRSHVLIVSSWGPFSSSISGPMIASNVSGESRPQLLAAAPDRTRGGIKVHILARSSAS